MKHSTTRNIYATPDEVLTQISQEFPSVSTLHKEITKLQRLYHEHKAEEQQPYDTEYRLNAVGRLLHAFISGGDLFYSEDLKADRLPPSVVLERMATYILADSLYKHIGDKRREDEFLILNERQSRHVNEREFGNLDVENYGSIKEIVGKSADGFVYAFHSEDIPGYYSIVKEAIEGGGLTDRQRVVAELVLLNRYTLAEVGEHLGVSTSRVGYLSQIVRRKIRKFIEEYEKEEL